MKPFSDNIIFVDTEFSSLDPYQGEVLSVGLVKLNGESFYVEVEHEGPVSDWVKEHILPTLTDTKLSRQDAKKKIIEFVGSQQPYAVAHVNQFDAIYLYKLLGLDDQPFFWIPIDFASMLFAVGRNPESYSVADKNNFFNEIGIDASKYHTHHALDDAKLLREVYLKLFSEKGGTFFEDLSEKD